jgi:hypothetical protein
LTNFLGRGAAVNHQTGSAVARLRNVSHYQVQAINPDNVPVSVNWDPIYFIKPC